MRVWHTQLVTPAESNTHSKMSNRHTRFQGYALAESNLHIKCYTLTKMSNRHTRFRGYALTESNLHIRCYAIAEFSPTYTSDVTPLQSLTHDFEVTLAESDTLNFEVSFTIFTMQCTKSFMNCLFLLYKTIFESSCLKKKIWRKKKNLKEIIHQVLVGSDPFLGQFFHDNNCVSENKDNWTSFLLYKAFLILV